MLVFALLGGMAGVGALSIFLVVRTAHDARVNMCMEANLREITMLLAFHSSKNGNEFEIYSLPL